LRFSFIDQSSSDEGLSLKIYDWDYCEIKANCQINLLP